MIDDETQWVPIRVGWHPEVLDPDDGLPMLFGIALKPDEIAAAEREEAET